MREPVHLTIVGDGEQRPQLEKQAARTGLAHRTTFLGSRFGADLVQSYTDADAFVLPSEKEGMALVALEAMAAALPVVATGCTPVLQSACAASGRPGGAPGTRSPGRHA